MCNLYYKYGDDDGHDDGFAGQKTGKQFMP